MRPISLTIGLTPADADGICAAQTKAGAGELLLSGGALSTCVGVARLGTAAQITVVCAADESTRTFTVTGVDANDHVTVEKIAGVDTNTATSTYSYREVSKVSVDGANTGNVEIGISGDDNAIATAATLTSASNYVLNGVLTYEATMFGVAEVGTAATVKIYSAGNDSGDTFTIYGQDANKVDISEAVTGANADTATSTKLFKKVYAIYDSGASAGAVYAGWVEDVDGIAKSQSMGGAGYLVMNGAYCSVQARHISITSASADESGVVFTVVGLDRRGARLTEEITGPTAAATVKGDKNFSIVQAVYISGALTGNVTIGSADECESQAVPIDYYIQGVSAAVHHSTGSSLTHRFLDTLDNVLSGERNENTARWNEETGTSTNDETFASVAVIKAVRLEVTAHTQGVVDLLMAFPGAVS